MRRYAMRPPAVFWVLLSFALLFPVGWAEAAGCTSISCAVSGSGGPYTTPYGAPIVIAFPIGDYAKDYYDSLLSPTSAGSLVEIGADANNDYVEFVPASGFTGQVSITSQYQKTNTDGGGGNQTIIVAGAAVTVTVLAPTPAPTTSNGSMTAAYNGSGSSTLNIAGSYTSVALGSPAHGTVTSAGGDGVTYTPYSGFSGTDSFSFSASGPGGVSNTSIETVTVGASPPTVGTGYLTVPYGTSGQVVAQVSGVYTSLSASNGSHGSVTLNGQTATYTPNSGFFGADSFTISAAGPGGTGTGTINVTVQPPSAPGVGNVYLSVGYGAAGSVGLAISGSYSSINLGSPSHGTASLNGSTVTYTSAGGYYGSDAITYSASGPGGTSGTAQVSITVSPPGGPSITGGSISTPYQTQGSLTLNVSGVYSSITATSPAHGSVAISGTTAAYTPVSGFYGADSFQVSASGPGGTSGLALVTVTVGLPPAPSVAPGSIGASYDGSGSTVLSVSGVYSLLSVSQPPADGSVSFSGATATYVPNSGYTGADSFTYIATGPGGVSAPATVNVQVAAPPAPTVAHASISSSYNGSGSTALSVSGVYSLLTVSRAPTHGSVSFSGAMATYVPNSGYYGADSFTYTATGPGGASSPATVSVQVALPPAPTVALGSISSTYNGSGSATLSASGVYTGLAIAQGPVHGSVSLSGATATYVPDAGYYGADSFTYTAAGPGGVSSSATVSVQVGLPAAPTIAGGSISTSYQTPGLLNLNVSGVESSITATSPAHGSVSISGTTTTYTPVSGFYGSDSFQVSASGPGGTSGLALVAVSVGLPPAPAVAAGSISSSYNGSGSTALSVTGVYSLVSVSQAPAHGAVTFSGATATYVPNGGYYGADSFTYMASGPGGVSPAATVSVQVALPPAPTAAPGSIRSAYNGSGSTALSVSGVYTGLAIAQGPAHGSVAFAGTTATYVPNTGYYGADNFTYTASGPGGVSSSAAVSVQVALPPAPTVGPGSISSSYNGSGSTTLSVSGVYSGVAVAQGPAHGTVSLSGATATYVPYAGYYGADSFSFTASGPGGVSSAATVSVHVALPPPPTTANTRLSLAYDTAGSVTLPASGVYSGAQMVNAPADGSVILSGETATYTPNAGYYGTDTFTYEIVGPGGASSTATATVTVNLPPPPTAGPASISTPYQVPGSVNLPVAGVYNQIGAVQSPAHGTVVITGATATYTPSPGFTGSDSFTYVVGGIGGVSSIATVSVSVGLPPPPVAQPLSLTTPYQTAGSVTLSATGNGTKFSLGLPPSHGSVTVTGSTAVYTPSAGYFGADAFSYTVTGPGGVSPSAQVTVQVGLPAAPTANAITLITPYGAAVSTALSGAGVITGAALAAGPSHGTAIVSSSGRTATYTPTSGYVGQDQFTYTLSGPGGVSQAATITVTVVPPAPPTTAPATLTTPFQTPVSVSLGVGGIETSVALVAQPTHGTVALQGLVATYTPAAGYYGVDSFSFEASGPGGTSNVSLVSVTVGLPGPPTVAAATATTPYQTPVAIALQVSGSYFSLTATSPQHGALSLSGTTAVYTPSSGFMGVDTFTFTAVGVGGSAAPAQVRVAVGRPGVPAAVPEQLTAPYQTPASVGLASVGVATGFAVAVQPSHGVAVVSNGSALYTPASGYSGPDSFTYVAIGPGGTSGPATVSATVLPTSSAAPLVQPLTASTPYQTPVVMALQVAGAYANLGIVAQPAHGSVVLVGASATYTPAQGFSGPDTYTAQAAAPGGALSNVQTMTVFVGYPATANVAPVYITTPYQTPVTAVLGAAGLGIYAATTRPSHGSVGIAGNLATYTPAAAFIGTDSFAFNLTLSDGSVASAKFTVVVAPPAPPAAQPQTIYTAYQSPTTVPLTISGVYSTVSVVAQPSSGNLAINNGQVTYTPVSGFSGTVTFTYTASGAGGTSSVTTVTIVVAPPPAPMGAPASTTTPYGAPVSIALTASGVYATITVATPPAHGMVTLSGTTASYTPAPGFVGTDSFTYVVAGPGGTSQAQTVTITVSPPPPPKGAPTSTTTPYGASVSIPLTVSGIYTIISVAMPPAHGTVTISGTTATYTPASGFFGTDTFTYLVVGPGGTSQAVTVTVTVLPPPPPSGSPVSTTTPYGATVSIPLTVSGIYTAINVVAAPGHGSVTISGTTATYTPAPGFFGTDTFTYVVVGPGGTSQVVTVTVTVLPPPPPVGAPASATTPNGAPLSIPLSVSGIYTSILVATPPAHGTVTISGATATYTPAPGFAGVDSFTFVVVGPGGKSQVVTVTITVLPGPVPIAPNLTEVVKSGASLTLPVAQGIAGAPVTAVAVTAQPADGRAATDGLIIVFYAPAEYDGVTRFTYTLTNEWGTSLPGTVTVQIEPVPIPMVKQASVLTGKTVTVDLTAGAAGGPFTSATVLSISPASAGSAVIKPDGAGGFELVFSPTGALQNTLVVQYTLANPYASAIGVVNIQVNPRPDPALDPEVTGVVNAMEQAADRFIDGQLGNIEARLDSLHNGPRRSHLGLSLLPMATVEAMGQVGTEQMQRDMDYYLTAGMVEPGPADDRTRSGNPPPGEAADPGWSAWLGGAISLGYQYGQGETLGGFSFSTTGISGGVDANLAKHWIGGVGLGYAQDESHIGQHNSKVLSSSIDAFLYETWQPTEKTFLDAALGGGGLSFGERRYLTTDGGTVTGRTSGADAFGFIKAGYDHRGRRWHVSPYLAVQFSYVAISRFAEPEDPTDTWSLIYRGQGTVQATGVIGVTCDYLVRTLFGDVLPTAKLEGRDAFVGGGVDPVSYEDWAHSPLYPVKIQLYGAERVTTGVGLKVLTSSGVATGLMVENTFEGRAGRETKLTLDLKAAF